LKRNGVQASGFRWVSGLGFGVKGFKMIIKGLGFVVEGLGFGA